MKFKIRQTRTFEADLAEIATNRDCTKIIGALLDALKESERYDWQTSFPPQGSRHGDTYKLRFYERYFVRFKLRHEPQGASGATILELMTIQWG